MRAIASGGTVATNQVIWLPQICSESIEAVIQRESLNWNIPSRLFDVRNLRELQAAFQQEANVRSYEFY
ncbi:hypothetical protein [Terriglobus albidus]|uniref:hypothetical protein n=1 Tax=Terriglobus albidus TaxID=1592106 RepID=UPI0021E053CB|nr:hypothetical protein [Terriglobus albidus]